MEGNMLSMFIIMILSGLLSTMNVWRDNIRDIRISLNDLYMALLMTGWMFTFMGILYQHYTYIMVGLLLIVFSYIAIRKQLFIGNIQYKLSMIPHHSMAIFMSKELLKKNISIPENIRQLASDIIEKQQVELSILKN